MSFGNQILFKGGHKDGQREWHSGPLPDRLQTLVPRTREQIREAVRSMGDEPRPITNDGIDQRQETYYRTMGKADDGAVIFMTEGKLVGST